MQNRLKSLLFFFLAVCSSNCLNGGTCSAPNVCTCLSTYTGSTCQTRRLKVKFLFQFIYSYCSAVCSSSCQNGGTCSAPNTCTCTSSYTGSTCITRKFVFLFQKHSQKYCHGLIFSQLFALHHVKTEAHVVRQILALVHPVIMVLHVQYVCDHISVN